MDHLTTLFDRMDAWRHLPNYQLERRADLFFSLYLVQALEAKVGWKLAPHILPEFPVRIRTIYPNTHNESSKKIDYVVLSNDGKRALLVELKTEGMSRRDEQDQYLVAARDCGMPNLVGGVVELFRATSAKRKYFHLLECLERMGQLAIPDQLRQRMDGASLVGADAASHDIRITSEVSECRVIYIQPNGASDDVISFAEFARTVRLDGSPLALRFARSLEEWARITAGARTR